MLNRLFAKKQLDINITSAKFNPVKKDIIYSHAQANRIANNGSRRCLDLEGSLAISRRRLGN